MEDYEAILDRVLGILTTGQDPTKNPTSEIKPTVRPVTSSSAIPVGLSNRHVHLSDQAVAKLFGTGHRLTPMKDLSQPGQYACQECVTLCGPKGVIEKVRVLGPTRSETQVEILQGDTFKLGVKGTIRLSGDLTDTAGITLVGPKGSLELEKGVIVAQRHIHMLPQDAERFNVRNGEIVSIKISGIRGGTLDNVAIRVDEKAGLECHIDTEEGNAFGLTPKSTVEIIK
ncbi:phosphate propanoyltransferase [Vagococcus silagei]|uniref:Phosphate propanoyltransferase n=1 Tax=Vagococcus silagei TaxID=2508885 RepID=A0A4S3B3Z0_9ENTE|nr:phosphate propanoyltransferase [Vagococcus silagei]THB60977.1 phosphate propanoyltransferase [Vagococcus silagei]